MIYNENIPVFGIGCGKTATTSLTEALKILGYNAVHFPSPGVLDEVFKGKYNAATDTSVALQFMHLHRAFPHAKFILTIRDTASWLKSIETHMSTKAKNAHQIEWIADVRRNLYGSVMFDAELYESAYKKHTHNVIQYFAANDIMNQLLVMDITQIPSDNVKWNKLCTFLDIEKVPSQPFPHSNKGRYNRLNSQKVDVFKITGA